MENLAGKRSRCRIAIIRSSRNLIFPPRPSQQTPQRRPNSHSHVHSLAGKGGRGGEAVYAKPAGGGGRGLDGLPGRNSPISQFARGHWE